MKRKMALIGEETFTLLALILALIMTLLALASYRSYEITKKRLAEHEAEVKTIQTSAQEFRLKTSEAFADQKSLKLRIETLERTLTLTNQELEKERKESQRVQDELNQLRTEYENTKLNLTEAYKRLRER